jgi:Flp pilus assembly protein TadB
MGRRSRARDRAATAATTQARAAAPAPRRSWLRQLNPFKFRELNRRRARAGAAGFGLAALLFAVLGWATGQPAWFSSAVLLAILALVWGITSAFLGEGDRTG